MAVKDEVGRAGESLARGWLERAGMQVIEANWRCRHGEIDLVVRDGADIVFVEVKTRRSLRHGHPAEAVTPVKLARLRRLAGLWLAEHRAAGTGQVRIDVVAILAEPGRPPRLQHLRGVA